jgi:hypothetical protein
MKVVADHLLARIEYPPKCPHPAAPAIRAALQWPVLEPPWMAWRPQARVCQRGPNCPPGTVQMPCGWGGRAEHTPQPSPRENTGKSHEGAVVLPATTRGSAHVNCNKSVSARRLTLPSPCRGPVPSLQSLPAPPGAVPWLPRGDFPDGTRWVLDEPWGGREAGLIQQPIPTESSPSGARPGWVSLIFAMCSLAWRASFSRCVAGIAINCRSCSWVRCSGTKNEWCGWGTSRSAALSTREAKPWVDSAR